MILYAIDFRPGDAGAKGIKLRQRALGELDLHAWRSLAAHSSRDGEPNPDPAAGLRVPNFGFVSQNRNKPR